MHWVVGIDEAGYGPNLGPLVQAAVAVRAPDDACLWHQLRDVIRRGEDGDDERLVIDDSKVVNAKPDGTARLERGVLATTAIHSLRPVGEFLQTCGAGSSLDDLCGEPWFDGSEPAPVWLAIQELEALRQQFAQCCEIAGVTIVALKVVITPAPRFNTLLRRYGSKGVVAGEGIIELLRTVRAAVNPGGPIHVVVDKQGGRNFYAPMLQTAFPDSWVHVLVESAERSAYRLSVDAAEFHLDFRPRAERFAMPVALASMLAKYLRERFMRQFNRFWLTHLPDVKPTAGYPTDASRFYAAIRPAMKKLGIAPHAVWRKR